jgi:ATP-dependent RNA helicase RhlE
LKTFEDIELIAPIKRALAEVNYITPTPVQAQTIPTALQGRDVLGCAQTGTGKTAAFALPILNRLGKHNRKAIPNRPFVLVLAPTRELAIQIHASFETYGKHLRLRQALVYGGVSQVSQVRALNRGAHVLVATPGRLLDLMNQGHIELSDLDVFVLDEADRMLDMGFLPDLKRIIKHLPDQRQSLFFSATLPPNITELSRRLLSNPASVNVTPETTSVETIEQQLMFVERSGKQSLLTSTLQADDVERALVFTKTKRSANVVTKQLVRSGITATVIHGNKSQNARQRALEAFRSKQVKVLVATDVAARGIDIDGITHVVNFDLPVEPESYVHRIGRTGRAGAAGVALSFCCSGERRELRAIEQLIGQKVPVANGHSEPQQRRTTSQPKNRPNAATRHRSHSNGSGRQRADSQRASNSADDKNTSKPRRRSRRKGLRRKQRVEQTST